VESLGELLLWIDRTWPVFPSLVTAWLHDPSTSTMRWWIVAVSIVALVLGVIGARTAQSVAFTSTSAAYGAGTTELRIWRALPGVGFVAGGIWLLVFGTPEAWRAATHFGPSVALIVSGLFLFVLGKKAVFTGSVPYGKAIEFLIMMLTGFGLVTLGIGIVLGLRALDAW
jgi:glucan phosphoethanolaminetransferase (alkaline phosphatase superfamily)